VRGRRLVIYALAVGCGCDLYIRPDDPDARFNDGGRPPDAVELDAARDGGGFPTLPSAPTHAHQQMPDGTWIDLGEADWACVGIPRDSGLTAPLSLSGRTVDWETGQPVGNQFITVLPSREVSPALGEVVSGGDVDNLGEFAGTFEPLPPGRTRYGFRTQNAVPAQTINFVVEQYFLPGAAHVRDLAIVSPATASTLPTFVGQTRDPSRAMVLGQVVDCQMRPVSNAMVVVSTSLTQSQPAGVDVWTFTAQLPSLPGGLNTPTREDGRVAIFDMPPDTAFALQVWGFRTGPEVINGELIRLATVTLNQPMLSVTTLKVEPRQTNP
jgi:hypothetical protein